MDVTALSKRTWEILDLAHGGKAIDDEGSAPPVVASWRLEQLETALREAERIEQAHDETKAGHRITAARKEIEETIAEIDRTRGLPVNLYDRIARFGVPFAGGWMVVASLLAFGHFAFFALYAVPVMIVAMRVSQAGREAIARQHHVDDLPFRLRLAWDKLAAAEAEVTRVQSKSPRDVN
jgi:hypothetical protein